MWYKLTRATDGHDYLITYQGNQPLGKRIVGPEAKEKIEALKNCVPHHVIIGDYAMDVSQVGAELWYPNAVRLKRQVTQGKRPNGVKGLVIHYPVWFREPEKVTQLNEMCIDNRHSYMICDGNGQMYQGAPMDEWGWHTGQARWRGLKSPLSAQFLGVEVCSWGHYEQLSPSIKRYVDKSLLVDLEKSRDNAPAGRYEKFSEKQIQSIMSLCFWLKDNFPEFEFDNVVAHSEISPGRKPDPGGCLPWSMDNFRDRLKLEYNRIRM